MQFMLRGEAGSGAARNDLGVFHRAHLQCRRRRMMAKYGLPSAVPFIGRRESDDSIMGMLGLALFVTSIAVRMTVVITTGSL